ncbi:MAG: hypothetical protein COA63_014145 [Methylophaga sp.]|nr:hypothetical protein [Methylophaga sp.]
MPNTTSCGSDILALELATNLDNTIGNNLPIVDLASATFLLPTTLYPAVNSLNISDLTDKTVDGNGSFDVVMASIHNHLDAEFRANRITGEQYTKAYIELTVAALSTANQFILEKDNSYWQSVIAQNQAKKAEIEAVVAAVQLETYKAQMITARYQLEAMKSDAALNKLKLASEDAKFCHVKTQTELGQKQIIQIEAQTVLVQEQLESQRAQTRDTHLDGSPILGNLGKQKDLYGQQIKSYQADTEYKTAKMYLDAWITQKTLDDGLAAPTELQNSTINSVMSAMRTNNGL